MIVANRDLFRYNTEIKWCLFHFGQSIWRQVGTRSSWISARLYTQWWSKKKTVWRICALALCIIIYYNLLLFLYNISTDNVLITIFIHDKCVFTFIF
jgi:hypothetical protein